MPPGLLDEMDKGVKEGVKPHTVGVFEEPAGSDMPSVDLSGMPEAVLAEGSDETLMPVMEEEAPAPPAQAEDSGVFQLDVETDPEARAGFENEDIRSDAILGDPSKMGAVPPPPHTSEEVLQPSVITDAPVALPGRDPPQVTPPPVPVSPPPAAPPSTQPAPPQAAPPRPVAPLLPPQPAPPTARPQQNAVVAMLPPAHDETDFSDVNVGDTGTSPVPASPPPAAPVTQQPVSRPSVTPQTTPPRARLPATLPPSPPPYETPDPLRTPAVEAQPPSARLDETTQDNTNPLPPHAPNRPDPAESPSMTQRQEVPTQQVQRNESSLWSNNLVRGSMGMIVVLLIVVGVLSWPDSPDELPSVDERAAIDPPVELILAKVGTVLCSADDIHNLGYSPPLFYAKTRSAKKYDRFHTLKCEKTTASGKVVMKPALGNYQMIPEDGHNWPEEALVFYKPKR
jgi:hypothetical protein